jgi:hypothetical protein
MRIRLGKELSAAALMMAAAAAWADGGVGLRGDSLNWPQWQGRLGVGTTSTLPSTNARDALRSDTNDARLGNLSVMGDYYMTGPLVARQQLTGGLRATGGMVIGPRSSLLSNPALPSSQASPFALSRLTGGSPMTTDGSTDVGTAPYLGIGYTGVSVKGAFSFSADFGLAGLGPPQSGLRFGRTVSGPQTLDDTLHDLRMTPVLQLGLSYSF